MTYSQLPIVEAEVRDLQLDLKNYRFPIDQPTENAAMNYLFAAHDVMSVARIILRDGYIDNELPFVVSEGGRLVILEGNRRLSALRALLDPSLVPSHQTDLERLRRRYPIEAADLPETIRVMRFTSREDAAPTLARLHIGDSKKSWSLDEQAKFVLAQLTDGVTAEQLREQLPAIKDVVRLIRMGRIRQMLLSVDFGDSTLNDYVQGDGLSMSSFEYAYRNPEIQSAIGISFDKNGDLATRPSTSLQEAALARLLRGFKTGELNTRRGLKRDSEDFRKLLSEMNEANPIPESSAPGNGGHEDSDTSKHSRGSRSTDSKAESAKNGDSSTRDSRSSRGEQEDVSRRGPNNPETKRNVDCSGIDESMIPLTLKHRIRELRRIDVVEFPAAATMLIRSVLEAVIKEHYGIKQGSQATGALSDVMARVTGDYGKNGQLAHAISTVNRTNRGASTVPGTGEWFNLVIHSVNIGVDAKQVHEAWRVVFPLVRFLLQSQYSPTPAP